MPRDSPDGSAATASVSSNPTPLSDDGLRALLEAAPDAIALVVDGQLVYANRRLLGLVSETANPERTEAERLQLLLERAELVREADGAQRGRIEVGLAEPTRRLEVFVASIGLAGRPGSAIFFRDVSAASLSPRETERRAQADRLTSLGRLAAGIAHEINNPLAYLLGSIAFVEGAARKAQEPGGDPLRDRGIVEALANAREGAERVRLIVRDLMAFARPATESKQLVNLEAVLDSMVSLAWNEIRHRARLVKRYSRVPAVVGDESRLGQVFLNLIVNAAQSIDAGGAPQGAITLSTALRGDRVVVEVADTGAGIGDENLSHVFEPFFTTKPAGKGTGLGLAICQTIVASHGGEIDVKSDQGQGATFRVSLPVAEQPSHESKAPPEQAPEAVASRARILIIDDEPLLGQTLTFAFSGRHDIVLATSGREAVRRLAEDSRYDLVLCDLMMPDVSGPKVFETVERDHPELVPRFAFMSGGAFTERAQEFLEHYSGRRIDKPFTIADVERLLAEIRPC
jgi:two-component system cell cycle sensor histidine kinase/response regulator CckA